jgi:16S rRNA (guanine(1405)-N(7))-methyltransferase
LSWWYDAELLDDQERGRSISGVLDPEVVLSRVAVSRRYRHVAQAVVLRLAAEEIPKSRNLAEAEKRTKRRLHQIFGAYTGQPDYPRLLVDMASARSSGDAEAVRALCREAMTLHASTRERLPALDAFYNALLAITGTPMSVLDLACGLNPLAAPWMRMADGARYVAWDIDAHLVGFVGGCLDLLGIEQQAGLRDIVGDPPVADTRVDLALLLKSVPCLDQQDPDAAARILRGIDARHIVVSFPTQSLSGRSKGMARTYRTRFAALLDTIGWQHRRVEEVEVPGELAFVVLGDER